MARTVSLESVKKMEEAFAMWMSGKTMKDISRTLGVPESTVYSWKERNDWEERRLQAHEKIQERVETAVVDIAEEVANQAYDMLKKIHEAFPNADDGSKKDLAAAYETLVKTIQLVTGGPTSRQEVASTSEVHNIDWSKIHSLFAESGAPTASVQVEDVEDPSEEKKSLSSALEDIGITLEEEGASLDDEVENDNNG